MRKGQGGRGFAGRNGCGSDKDDHSISPGHGVSRARFWAAHPARVCALSRLAFCTSLPDQASRQSVGLALSPSRHAQDGMPLSRG